MKQLSATAEAIKNYKLNFDYTRGMEDWLKVPQT